MAENPSRDDRPSAREDAPRRYASPLIAERRSRILHETKRLIGEVGVEGFTLRDLGERAAVSVTTVYNIFGDKEGVIAHALREFDAGIRLVLPAGGANLTAVCRVIADTTAVVVQNRAYSLALADLYFSRSLAPTLFAVIRGMPLQVFSHWLWAAGRDGLLNGTQDAIRAETTFANLDWACIKDWGAGRIADADLADVRQRGFLGLVMALAAEPLRGAAADMLRPPA